ncbi:18251_t:CDS:2 [Gigaspora rosea]|nr:18251_t:CDS:2 [Gigaspora rosea]
MPRKRKADTCGNPLFLKWLGEWMESASAANNKAYYTYKKAYDSMSKYPLPFQHPTEAAILSGIGPGICQRLEMRLKQHCEETGQPVPQRPDELPTLSKSKKSKKSNSQDNLSCDYEPEPKRQKTTTTTPKIYVPKYRSGAYAIMLALYKSSEINSNSSMTKTDLIKEAQRYCDSSFDIPSGNQKFYTAWNSMKTLLDKNYVYKNGYPSRFSLTDSGILVARQIVQTASLQGNDPFSNLVQVTTTNFDNVSVQDILPTNIENNTLEKIYKIEKNLKIEKVHKIEKNHKIEKVYEIEKNHTTEKDPIIIDLRESSDEEFDQVGNSGNNKHELSADLTKLITTDFTSSVSSANTIPIIIDLMESSDEEPNQVVNSGNNKYAQSDLTTGTLISTDSTSSTSSSTLFTSSTSSTLFTSSTSSTLFTPSTSSTLFTPSTSSTLFTPSTSSTLSTSSTSSNSLNNFKPIVWEPGTFEIVLILDTREVKLKKDRDYIKDTLQDKGVNLSVRNLELGDVIWVARKNSLSTDELVLDYILERKRMDDLVGSIKDGRFREQKFRLSKSGAGQIIYLIEDYNLEDLGDFGDAVKTAISSLQMLNGYFLKRTATIDQSIDYLVRMTRMLKEMYENLATLHPHHTYLVTYSSYSDLNSKSKPLTLKDTFVRMLMTIRGISVDKAAEIIKNYPTPRKLIQEFNSLTNEDDKKKMIMNACNGIIRRKKIGPSLSDKIYQIWCANNYHSLA